MRQVFVCLVAVVLSIVQSTLGLPSQGVVSTVEDDLSRSVTFIENEVNIIGQEVATFISGGCTCANNACGCCSHLELHEIHLNSTVCTNVTYLSEDYGISFTVTVDDYTLYNETVSARNPPPVCMGAPFVKQLAEACVRLYDIQTTRRSLHACARVEARMKTILLAKYDLGCFNIGNSSWTGTREKEFVPTVSIL